ncbi:MAG: ABC transporter permease subunit [Clostridia bacterium]|nr:ABC transporter permease subunit [Clostridia bacterium]
MFKLKCDDFLTYDEETGTYSVPADQQVRDEVEKKRWKDIGLTVLKDWRLYLMLVPMVVVYILWKYVPIYELLAVFKDNSTATVLDDLKWSGFDNFIALFAGTGPYSTYYVEFWRAFRNTFILAFYGLLFGFPLPIILALFFNEIRSNIARNIMQVCVYLPKFMSVVVITTLIISLFGGRSDDGVIAKLLIAIFGDDSPIANAAIDGGIVYSSRYFRGVFVISDLWEHAGYDSIVFFAAVIAISPTSYEAAQIDGAGKMQQMRYIVIPGILSTVVIMLIMKMGSLLSVSYEKVYLFVNTTSTYNRGQSYYVGTTVSVWANATTNTPIAMAGEMINNLIGMILVIGSNAVSRRATDVSLY